GGRQGAGGADAVGRREGPLRRAGVVARPRRVPSRHRPAGPPGGAGPERRNGPRPGPRLTLRPPGAARLVRRTVRQFSTPRKPHRGIIASGNEPRPNRAHRAASAVGTLFAIPSTWGNRRRIEMGATARWTPCTPGRRTVRQPGRTAMLTLLRRVFTVELPQEK